MSYQGYDEDDGPSSFASSSKLGHFIIRPEEQCQPGPSRATSRAPSAPPLSSSSSVSTSTSLATENYQVDRNNSVRRLLTSWEQIAQRYANFPEDEDVEILLANEDDEPAIANWRDMSKIEALERNKFGAFAEQFGFGSDDGEDDEEEEEEEGDSSSDELSKWDDVPQQYSDPLDFREVKRRLLAAAPPASGRSSSVRPASSQFIPPPRLHSLPPAPAVKRKWRSALDDEMVEERIKPTAPLSGFISFSSSSDEESEAHSSGASDLDSDCELLSDSMASLSDGHEDGGEDDDEEDMLISALNLKSFTPAPAPKHPHKFFPHSMISPSPYIKLFSPPPGEEEVSHLHPQSQASDEDEDEDDIAPLRRGSCPPVFVSTPYRQQKPPPQRPILPPHRTLLSSGLRKSYTPAAVLLKNRIMSPMSEASEEEEDYRRPSSPTSSRRRSKSRLSEASNATDLRLPPMKIGLRSSIKPSTAAPSPSRSDNVHQQEAGLSGCQSNAGSPWILSSGVREMEEADDQQEGSDDEIVFLWSTNTPTSATDVCTTLARSASTNPAPAPTNLSSTSTLPTERIKRLAQIYYFVSPTRVKDVCDQFNLDVGNIMKTLSRENDMAKLNGGMAFSVPPSPPKTSPQSLRQRSLSGSLRTTTASQQPPQLSSLSSAIFTTSSTPKRPRIMNAQLLPSPSSSSPIAPLMSNPNRNNCGFPFPTPPLSQGSVSSISRVQASLAHLLPSSPVPPSESESRSELDTSRSRSSTPFKQLFKPAVSEVLDDDDDTSCENETSIERDEEGESEEESEDDESSEDELMLAPIFKKARTEGPEAYEVRLISPPSSPSLGLPEELSVVEDMDEPFALELPAASNSKLPPSPPLIQQLLAARTSSPSPQPFVPMRKSQRKKRKRRMYPDSPDCFDDGDSPSVSNITRSSSILHRSSTIISAWALNEDEEDRVMDDGDESDDPLGM